MCLPFTESNYIFHSKYEIGKNLGTLAGQVLFFTTILICPTTCFEKVNGDIVGKISSPCSFNGDQLPNKCSTLRAPCIIHTTMRLVQSI